MFTEEGKERNCFLSTLHQRTSIALSEGSTAKLFKLFSSTLVHRKSIVWSDFEFANSEKASALNSQPARVKSFKFDRPEMLLLFSLLSKRDEKKERKKEKYFGKPSIVGRRD
jgi:hypothetical protein